MVIKYCSICDGMPYTNNLSLDFCPICGSALDIEYVSEDSLSDRAQINTSQPLETADKDGFDKLATYDEKERIIPIDNGSLNVLENPSPKEIEVKKQAVSDGIIRGKISQYSSTGREDGLYRRLFPVKVFQALVYHQRLEDVLHRFTVRVDQGEDSLGYQNYTDIPVNVHGTIAGGLQLVDNAEVEVHGKYLNGVLMADSIYVINSGHRSKVGFQRSIKAITYGMLFAVMCAFVLFVAATSNQDFFLGLKTFCTVWLVFAAILSVLYLLTRLSKIALITRMFSKKKQSFPVFGILLLSLALAFLFVSAFGSFAGFGSYLSGWIYSIIPVIVIIVVIFFLIKSLF